MKELKEFPFPQIFPYDKDAVLKPHRIGEREDQFIGGWVIDSPIYQEIIDWFEANPEVQENGMVGAGYVPGVKKSTDIKLSEHNPGLFNRYEHDILQPCVNQYIKKYNEVDNMGPWSQTECCLIQRYLPGEGFYRWHSERQGPHVNNRLLTYITYLNDVKVGGGTEFMYQKDSVNAERGLTIIFPVEWTHTHRGIVAPEETKYIVTGWFNFTGDGNYVA